MGDTRRDIQNLSCNIQVDQNAPQKQKHDKAASDPLGFAYI